MTTRMGRRGGILAGAAAGVTIALSAPVSAQIPELVSHTALRVCADPSNLPLSNQKREGFENKIADVIGKDLGLPVTYVWFPQVVGFVRNTLRKDQCDLVPGAVSGDAVMDHTNPYYHSGYMLVSRADAGIAADSLADPALAGKRIGLIAATPPTDILIRRHMMDQVTTYALVVDTRFDSPAREMAQDVVDHKIDVGLLWGPFAGYFIHREHLPLKAVFLKSDGPERLDFRISMGVRAGEPEWRRRIDQALSRHADEIQAILKDYGVPLLDEQGKPVDPAPGP